jgi:hypothetical protein
MTKETNQSTDPVLASLIDVVDKINIEEPKLAGSS